MKRLLLVTIISGGFFATASAQSGKTAAQGSKAQAGIEPVAAKAVTPVQGSAPSVAVVAVTPAAPGTPPSPASPAKPKTKAEITAERSVQPAADVDPRSRIN